MLGNVSFYTFRLLRMLEKSSFEIVDELKYSDRSPMGSWNVSEILLALLVDEIRQLNFILRNRRD